MNRKRKWHGVPGHLAIEVFRDAVGGWTRLDTETELPVPLWPILDAARALHGEIDELVVYFRSSGYYDPGKTSGPPERCYPLEGDDERELDRVLVCAGGNYFDLPADAAQRVFDALLDEVMQADLDGNEDGD